MSWWVETIEYIGYLMSSRDTPSDTLSADQGDSTFRSEYICVSSAAESAPGSVSNDVLSAHWIS